MENASAAFLGAVRRSMRVICTAIGATMINPELLTCAERLQYTAICGARRPTQRSWRSSRMACRLRRSSVEPGTAVNSLVRSVEARARISSERGRARSTRTYPSSMPNGLRAAVTARSSGVVCRLTASEARYVSSANGRHGGDVRRRQPTNNCKRCLLRERSYD